jgi:5-methylcytosine-specific restriction endonuclease McrA
MKTCPHCHKQFLDKKHKQKTFCSRQCWKEAMREKATVFCAQCGGGFIPNTIGKNKFCSWKCRIKSKDKIIECLYCQKEFRVSASINRKFCTQTCSNRYNRIPDPNKKDIFICRWCGNGFVGWIYRKPTICSNQCRSEYGASIRAKQLYRGGGVKSRGMNWKKQSRLAKKRDNYTCQVCGRDGRIEHFHISVHHIIPYREFREDYEAANNLSNLVSLCPSCHPKVECGTIRLPQYS